MIQYAFTVYVYTTVLFYVLVQIAPLDNNEILTTAPSLNSYNGTFNYISLGP